jgi:hypothetical protein
MDCRTGKTKTKTKTKTSRYLKILQWMKLLSLLDSVQILLHYLNKTVKIVGTSSEHGRYIKCIPK